MTARKAHGRESHLTSSLSFGRMEDETAGEGDGETRGGERQKCSANVKPDKGDPN